MPGALRKSSPPSKTASGCDIFPRGGDDELRGDEVRAARV
jgi:hypothetical protein